MRLLNALVQNVSDAPPENRPLNVIWAEFEIVVIDDLEQAFFRRGIHERHLRKGDEFFELGEQRVIIGSFALQIGPGDGLVLLLLNGEPLA